jgi:uncharacterized protein YjbI with pentapeptide repeats
MPGLGFHSLRALYIFLPGKAAPGANGHAPSAEDAEKAHDLDEIKQAVDDAASVSGALWFSYLGVLFYLGVASGAVTHKDLFLENSVKLPFLNVDLPLLAFFIVAPILFVIVHAYTLVHLVMLTEKAKRLDYALHDPKAKMPGEKVENLQWRLPSNIFIQFLAGPPELRQGRFGWALRTIAWITLVIAPVLLLLLMQIQFLPYHQPSITWIHRFALLADLILIWWLWRRILAGRESHGRRRRFWAGSALAFVLSACVFVFSWALASFPGERQWDAWRPIHERDRNRNPIMVSVSEWVFNPRIDPTSHRPRWPLSSTLALVDFNIYEGLNIDDPDKVKAREFVFRAAGRDLKGAIFNFARLSKVDFHGTQLQGASLYGARLEGALLDSAQLQGASLGSAHLEGASLYKTHLEDAHLDGAGLQGAYVDFGYLERASLVGAELQGASLVYADLQHAIFDSAQLQGASLVNAELQGASLDGAWLLGTSLASANLQGASLRGPRLQGTSLAGAKLQGTNPIPPPLPPSEVAAWKAAWKKALDPGADATYQTALAAALKDLVCSGDNHAIEILRGILGRFSDQQQTFNRQLFAAGAEASKLVDFINAETPTLLDLINNKGDCPVRAKLTEEDKGRMLQVKHDASAPQQTN